MTRFLTLLAVAAIAGVMYVAAAPGGLRSSGPTAKQFRALKASVTKLQKQVKSVNKLAGEEAVILVGCLLHQAQAVDQRGTAGAYPGYIYYTSATAGATTTALDLAPSSETSSQFYFLGVNPQCASSINSSGGASAASHAAGAMQHLSAQVGR
jgi:hypothetical protein